MPKFNPVALIMGDDGSRLAIAITALGESEARYAAEVAKSAAREALLTRQRDALHSFYEMTLREKGYTCGFVANGSFVIEPIKV